VVFGVLFIVFALLMRSLDNLLWLAFRMVAFTYGPLLGAIVVATMTDWKIDGRKVLALMLGCTGLTFALGMAAWYLTAHGTTSVFWIQLQDTYWRLYVIFGALVVPAGCWLMRER
jgi:hypothetical protein